MSTFVVGQERGIEKYEVRCFAVRDVTMKRRKPDERRAELRARLRRTATNSRIASTCCAGFASRSGFTRS